MRPATVSLVIPALNEAAVIADLLPDLRARFADATLVVVDGGSSDATVQQALPHCDVLLLGAAGRALQMNLGARAQMSDYIVFLHADSSPQVDMDQLQSYLQGRPAWGFCRVRLSGRHPVFRLIEWSMNWRSRLTRVATGDQMLFVRGDVFRSTGGFDTIPLMEDVAYCKRLRALDRPLVIVEPVLTSSRRWLERGVLRTVVQMWVLRFAYFLGVSPQRLWQAYYGR